jgi:hypothetical protein
LRLRVKIAPCGAVFGAPLRGNPSRFSLGRSLGAPRYSGTSKAAVCRTFGLKRTTLIDFLAWIGWSAGLRETRDTGRYE